MPKPLVIVESPAKAKTIAGYLGGDFTVKASVGHIRDLPGSKDEVPDAKKDSHGRSSRGVRSGSRTLLPSHSP